MLKKASSSMSSSELAKMRMQIGDTVPDDVVSSMTQELADEEAQPSSSSSFQRPVGFKSPMLCDVEAEIQRRIRALGKSGQMFEDNAQYVQDQQLAADAEYLVRGIDPQVHPLN